ncbi:LysR family transcriptional regulator [Cupriavidus basilensis]|uniref:LysR family transcriptional regulator n=1 Tax=Cupriavidus basilensis TaxID=68895 RepID=A0ABT6ALN7_9BURK|nr:LysR family transcriptional regulator [Cupriavidus basilensis]MDF3833232.1 LysR family transcriptional regulator [Cupriavidus basilensis]
MELRQLRQFVVLAEELSFSAAAQRLFMAQPALSVAIRKLEEEIETPLFLRGSRGVRLTPAGEAALEATRRCLNSAGGIKEAARLAAAGELGTLRIGFSGSVTLRLLPGLVQTFSRRYPDVKLELREGTNLELLTLVEAGTLDLGFVRVPASRPPDLRFQLVEEDCLCLALPRSHALAKKASIPLAALEGQPFIGYAPSPVGGLHSAVNLVLQRAGVAPRITQEAVQVQTALGLVASGLGVAMVPAANTPYQRSSGAVFRPIADLPADARIGIALAHHSRNDSPVMQRFLEISAMRANVEPRRKTGVA